VSGLVNGSPAKKNGLSIGDEILELNSISVTNSSLLDIFALLNDPEKSDLNLKVERDGAVLKFRLEKMEL
jgi:C-terminal processing protease CtpA/Prc